MPVVLEVGRVVVLIVGLVVVLVVGLVVGWVVVGVGRQDSTVVIDRRRKRASLLIYQPELLVLSWRDLVHLELIFKGLGIGNRLFGNHSFSVHQQFFHKTLVAIEATGHVIG